MLNGFKIRSNGLPLAKYGMSWLGAILDMTPLLPWRPQILSPVRMEQLTINMTFTWSIANASIVPKLFKCVSI